jgi:dTDP-4-amino-4,6-dideoxygalactose transaminase
LLICVEKLNSKNIFPRRYFYPSLNTVNYLQNVEMPISESISKRILCLPLYMGISKADIETVTEQI